MAAPGPDTRHMVEIAIDAVRVLSNKAEHFEYETLHSEQLLAILEPLYGFPGFHPLSKSWGSGPGPDRPLSIEPTQLSKR